MKKPLFITLLLAVVVASIGYWYYHSFGGGPKYSLLQAVYAVQTHDVTDFERYVDVESVTDKLVDQFAQQGEALHLTDTRSAALLQTLPMLKPLLRRTAQSEVQQYIKTGSIRTNQQGPIPGVSVVGMAGQVMGAGGQFKGIKYVHEQGEQALVGVEFAQPAHDTTSIVELRMIDKGDHWQVTEITNTGELIKQAVRWRSPQK